MIAVPQLLFFRCGYPGEYLFDRSDFTRIVEGISGDRANQGRKFSPLEESNHFLRWRLAQRFIAAGQHVAFLDHRQKIQLELPRCGFDGESDIGDSACDIGSNRRMREFAPLKIGKRGAK